MMFIIVFSFLPFIWAQSDFDKVPDDEWPSQVIFDTIHVCYQGTLRWVAMGNPTLMSQQPPYHISRIMTVHCFCVMDKIRTDYKYTAYVDYINTCSNDIIETFNVLGIEAGRQVLIDEITSYGRSDNFILPVDHNLIRDIYPANY